ncbi:MAG: hypothetical protein ABIO40_05415 [Devosia sp.]
MRSLKVAVLGVAAAALISGAALAADMPMLEDDFVSDPSIWDGLYVGASGGFYLSGYGDVDLVAGFNFTPADMFVLGVEGGVGAYFGPSSGLEAYVSARAGIALTDTALVYGTVGTYIYGGGGTSPFIGAGVEFALDDSMSARIQGITFGGDGIISAGLFWHL